MCGIAGLLGGDFTGDAQAAIHTATDGIPRLINQVCDHALMLAALGRKRQIDAAGVGEAWADLQQLPIPLTEPPALRRGAAEQAGFVEFGQLGESPTVVAGNIGEPVLDVLATHEAGERWPDVFVLELSSYQLETTSSLKPVAATVLNVTANHMDRYAGLADYAAAKARIFANASVIISSAPPQYSLTSPKRRNFTFPLCLKISVRR